MATRFLTRSLLTTTKHSISSFQRSFASASLSTPPSISFLRLRPLVAVTANIRQPSSSSGTAVRGFSTRRTSSSLNDPNPNLSNRPPKETILPDGCDFEHWFVVMEKPEGDPTRDEIIDSYVKTLAKIVGSEEEARMKIYSVSTRHYYAFGALVSEELSYKLKELGEVRWVLPDCYLDVKNKYYGGEPFINGQAVPYELKYHEEWVRNNARSKRNRRDDRPRNMSGPPYHEMSGGLPPNMRGMQGNNMGQPSSNYNPGGPPGNINGRPYNAGGPGNAPTFQHVNAPVNNGMPYQFQSAPGQQQNNYAPNPPGAYPSYNNQNQPTPPLLG